MYLKYGNHQHAAGEVILNGIMQEGVASDEGVVYQINERWNLEGRLQISDQGSAAANQAEMTVQINALKAAYATNGRDIGFYDDSGNLTSHSITSASTQRGVQVVQQPSFPEGRGAEYSTFRTYTIVVEAQYGYTGGGGSVLQWTEAVSYRGTGGPTWGFLVPINGDPQKQLLTQQSTHWAYQRGRATGRASYPVPPAPMWPTLEHQEMRDIEYAIPSGQSNKRTVSWSYAFEATSPLSGQSVPQ